MFSALWELSQGKVRKGLKIFKYIYIYIYIYTYVWNDTCQYINIGYSGEDSGEFQFYFFRYLYCILFYFSPKKKKKEAEEVGLNTVLGSVHLILQALGSH